MNSKNDEKFVINNFWNKIKNLSTSIPFVVDVVAMYYALLDSNTSIAVKASIVGALAYFILPIDAIPDVMVGVGYVDDAGVIATTLAAIESSIKKEHYKKAENYLNEK